jgi:hypothetical protein
MEFKIVETLEQRVLIIKIHHLIIRHNETAVADFAVRQMLACGADRVDVMAS